MRLARITGISAALFFAALGVLSAGWLQPGDQLVFDSRVLGYSVVDAKAYVAALNADQLALYLGLFRWIDTVFPILLTLTLVALMAGREGRRAMRGFAVAAAFVYLFFDLRENGLVARILKAGAGMSEDLVMMASLATVLKWAALAASVVLVLAVLWHGRRGQGA